MAYDFTLSEIIPATPQQIYDAWLDSEGHTKMTGRTSIASTEIGAKYTAAYNYISGVNVELVSGKRILQTWRTTDFTDSDPDSQIEVILEPISGGTRLTLHHTNVPDDHTGYENGGWQTNYFEPMKKFFGEGISSTWPD